MNRFSLTAPKVPKLKEKGVAEACCNYLLLRGWWPQRLQVAKVQLPDGRWFVAGEKGDPDYVVIHVRYPAFYMETKRPGGKRSPAQVQKHYEMTAAYKLTVVTIDSVERLASWLMEYEAACREREKNR